MFGINHIIYGGICFIAGGCIGGAIAGHFVAKDAKKQIDEADKRNKALVDEVVRLRETNMEKREAKIKAEEKKYEESIESLRKSYARAAEFEEYDDDDYDLDLEQYDIPKRETVVVYNDDEDNEEEIKLIDKDVHDILLTNTDARTEKLKYYQANGFLVDSDDEVITYEEQIIGPDAMDIIDDTKNDYIYVHDPSNDTVYEIEIDHTEMYQRDLAGVNV